MENFIIHPFISLICSILLFLGSWEFGRIVFFNKTLSGVINKISDCRFQYFSATFVTLLIFLFPLIAFTNNANLILKLTAIVLILLSIKFLIRFFLEFKINSYKSYFSKDIYFYILFLTIFLYFLLSLSPQTAADVLDYHLGVSLNILRFDQYLLNSEWFTGLQASSGETLIALGLSVGSEQFGSLVQFSSLLSITGILIKFCSTNNNLKNKYFIPLIIVTCPIIIFLASGNKPQIFYSSILFVAFTLNFSHSDEKDKLINYLLINILIFLCLSGKFSFNLSGFLVWAFSTLRIINNKNFLRLILISGITFLLIYFPNLYWKYIQFEGSLISYLFSPFPLHLPGYESFFDHNKGSQEIPFPLFFIYTTASRMTETLGFSVLILFFVILNIKINKDFKIIIFMIFLFVTISNIYSSPSSRYYLDPLLWLALMFTFVKETKTINYFRYIFCTQILAVIIILSYSIISFLPGSTSWENYKNVKNKYAYLYSGFEWVNKNVPDDSVIIFMDRPISQYKNFSISAIYANFTNKKEAIYYNELIKEYKPNLIVSFNKNPDFKHLKNCTNGVFKIKKNVGYHATRNPFNKGSSYNAYVYNFDYSKLPLC
jgi:hypothetical protein